MRKAKNGDFVVVVCSFTPEVRHGYRIGVPLPGVYREVFNSDRAAFGGSDVKNEGPLYAEPTPWHERGQSLVLTLPPLGVIYLRHEPEKSTESSEESEKQG